MKPDCVLVRNCHIYSPFCEKMYLYQTYVSRHVIVYKYVNNGQLVIMCEFY